MVQAAAQQRLRLRDRQRIVDHEVGALRHLDALSAYGETPIYCEERQERKRSREKNLCALREPAGCLRGENHVAPQKLVGWLVGYATN